MNVCNISNFHGLDEPVSRMWLMSEFAKIHKHSDEVRKVHRRLDDAEDDIAQIRRIVSRTWRGRSKVMYQLCSILYKQRVVCLSTIADDTTRRHE